MDKIIKKFSDVKVEVEGKVYKLHKVMLYSIPYFRAYFNNNFGDDQNYIVLEDISRDISPIHDHKRGHIFRRNSKDGRRS